MEEECVLLVPICLSVWLPACSGEVRFSISSLCRKNLKLNIAFYHPQHKPDKPCPSLCASLLTAIITHCGSDIELAHSSGHAAPFMMCPHSTHPLYQQCEGGGGCKAPVEQALASESCSRRVSSFRSPCWRLPVITSEIAANAENWHNLGAFVAACDACSRNLLTIWKASFQNAKCPLQTESSSLSSISLMKLKRCRLFDVSWLSFKLEILQQDVGFVYLCFI